MSARERATEIAVIRALGFRRGQVLVLVLSEAMVLALLGGVAGILLSFPFTALVIDLMKHSPAAPFAFNLRVHPSAIATAFAASVAIGTLSGFIPALRSARVSIVEGLRQVV
jgi:putative ABC transport system permease protein